MIPANIITGFLGVGKTTAVLDLLKRKNPLEKWAVLVNEYGEVSIDEALLEGETSPADGVSVRSVAGGCFCCTTAPMLPVALHFLLRDSKPDRLLIETSGLGHPARLVDMIRANYADRLELRATLGLVTPNDFSAPGMIDSNPVFRDQMQMSDVLILNKSDTAGPGVVEAFQKWANDLDPPKLLIAATTHGRLDPAWLDLSHADERRPLHPEAHSENEAIETIPLGSPRPGRPHRFPSPGACGWLFHPSDVFDEEALLELFQHPSIQRLKGVFHVEDEWIAVNRSGGSTSVKRTAYRRDSRLEVFGEDYPGGWCELENGLLKCFQSGATASP